MDFNGLNDLGPGTRYFIREFAPEAGRCMSGVRSGGTGGMTGKRIGMIRAQHIGTIRAQAPGDILRWEGGGMKRRMSRTWACVRVEVFNGLPSSIVNDINS